LTFDIRKRVVHRTLDLTLVKTDCPQRLLSSPAIGEFFRKFDGPPAEFIR